LAVLFLACKQRDDQTQSPRLRINFDENWKFHLGHATDPSKDFNYGLANIFSKSGKCEGTAIDPKFDDSQWRTLHIPHDWAIELPFVYSPNFDVMAHGYKPVGGLFPETSVGWYRKNFLIARADSGYRYSIQFDGIFRDAIIWLNGFYLGNNKSGYIGDNYDITDYINFHGNNVLVVRVDATQYEGWFYEGAGIYRHVWLNRHHNVHFPENGVFVHSEVNGNKATVNVETKVRNLSVNNLTMLSIHSYISDRDGNRIAETQETPFSLFQNEEKVAKQRMTLKNPRLWSLDDPYRYRVTSVIKQNGKVIDRVETRTGIRTLAFDAQKGFFLNGKHLKIQGVNCHQDHAGVGSALPDYLQYYRIKLLKEMGVNAYRTSHNAPTPELLDACDSLGMLVMCETRLLNSSPEYMDQFERLILRDRNHPSVFIWSIGNEEGYVQWNSIGKRLALSLLALQKELDPTRTSTYGADLGNVFTGINEVIPVRGFNYRHKYMEEYHNDHPSQPIIGTEMGSTVTTRGIYEKDTIRCYVPDQDITFPWWASRAEDWWPLAAENNWILGGFIWTGFDYRGEPTPFQWPNINSHFGVMDMCGFPKNIYYYYKSWWKNEPVLHISPHWNWKGKEGQDIDVWVNSNAESVELFLNGKSLGKKEMPRNSHLKWAVKYEPGTLSAIGFNDEKEIEAKVETTDKPLDIVVSPYKTTMIANGRDATVINFSVSDQLGREVPDAQNLLKFTITGDAKILGVGNGDPSSHEPDICPDGKWQRKLFNGKCQLILQAGKNTGIIKLKVESEGIWPGGTEIHTIASDAKLVYPKINRDAPKKDIGKMLGADISFLPELEDKGIKFKIDGEEVDAIKALKDNGFNYVRLRIFNNPETEKGYSPSKGFCDLDHTKAMAKRVKEAGLKLLLDFHYSDYWADPQQQFKPSHWENLNFDELKSALKDYTKNVLNELKQQGTLPEMVQIGNEINHGMVWPDGHIGNLDNLAELIKAGIEGVKEVDPSIIVMLHVALGGQNDESVFWFNNMMGRGVDFDVIGLSYYPRWHCTLNDLQNNMADLIKRYDKDIILVEYSHVKREVNHITFNLPNGRGKGTCIWEPLNTWESIFDWEGNANQLLPIYKEIANKHGIN
jgi:beta-galactosidase